MVVPSPLEDSSIAQKKDNRTVNERKTIEDLEVENAQLKHTIELLSKRVADLERTQQENNMLRSSIIQFRQDIQRQVSGTDIASPKPAVVCFDTPIEIAQSEQNEHVYHFSA
jgi:hypothetical protein